VGTVSPTQSVEVFAGSLGQNDRVSRAYGGPVLIVWKAACTENIFVGNDVWMKRQNHANIPGA
jgi:hypothetical protein